VGIGEVVVDEQTVKGYIGSDPEVITLEIGPGGGNGVGVTLDTWKSYSFNSNFLTATDGWSFTLGDDTITDEVRIAIAPRQKVILRINGNVQCTGYVDKVSTRSSRSGGTEITIEGRDTLSPAVDSVIDPRLKFTPEMKLLELLRAVFGPFGFKLENQFLIDNEDNRNVMSGRKHKTTKAGAVHNQKVIDKARKDAIEHNKAARLAQHRELRPGEKPTKLKLVPVPGSLSNYDLHLLKPDLHETAFTFASRVAQRFGLWIWATADGDHLVIGKPNFEQDPDFEAVHRRNTGTGAANNVLSASVTMDGGSQPSVIFASGSGTGGENPRDQFTLGVVNPGIQTDNSVLFEAYSKTRMLDISYLGDGYSGTTEISTPGGAYVDTFARPLYLTDANSKSQEELECFLKRELALRRQKAFSYTFEVLGHNYTAGDGAKVPWTVDMVVSVEDDYCDVHEDLWVIGRTFTKSRNGGTTTKLECVRLHTLEF
jgi:prophage tail gpP-like protein